MVDRHQQGQTTPSSPGMTSYTFLAALMVLTGLMTCGRMSLAPTRGRNSIALDIFRLRVRGIPRRLSMIRCIFLVVAHKKALTLGIWQLSGYLPDAGTCSKTWDILL